MPKIPYYTSKKGTKWCMPSSGRYFTSEERAVLDKNNFRVFETRDGERASESTPPTPTGELS